MKKQSNTYYLSLLIGFVFFLGTGFVLNIKMFAYQSKELYSLCTQEGYSKGLFDKIDNLYRENVYNKKNWVELYGIAQRGLGREIIGNMEFAKGDNGLMHLLFSMNEGDMKNADQIGIDLIRMDRYCKEMGIPFLYVPVPEKNDGSIPEALVNKKQYFEKLRNIIAGQNIDLIDVNDILNQVEMPKDEFFFKTDIHLTTEGELLIANAVAKSLREEGVYVGDELITGIDDSRYHIRSHKLLGNLVRSVGKYYNGQDIFNEYAPVNDTDTQFTMTDLVSNNIIRQGTYSQVITNGYELLEKEDQYWVTNYLRFAEYAYNIENKQTDGPDLLVICDSYAYRTVAFLTLGCNNITVIDPRYPVDGFDAIETAIERYNYDAVICIHGQQLGARLYGQ